MPKHSKQHTMWLLAAASAPLAHFSGCGWFPALLAAAAVLPLSLVPKCWDEMPRSLALVQILWIGVVAGALLRNSAAYWPSDNDLAVPLTLLALAAVTPKGSAPRIGAVLAFCTGLLALPVVVSGATNMELKWMGWSTGPFPAGLSLVLLFPALPSAGEGKMTRKSLWTGVLAIVLALLVQGTISPQVAGSVADPFYQTARTLGYLEPVAAVGMTLGWYAATVFMLTSAAVIAEACGIGKRRSYALAVGAALFSILIKRQPLFPVCAVLSTFMWVLVPFLAKIKKSKNPEKNA